ncbi:hypothetical protein [Fuscibacter oryzae]|uniref:Uncharacterized protein n=1 Tax=Fuscibacter oryzae TaxID=2803939 RepID=A0A8J7MQT6_9RHOB|nr:hypothetical protein [Fuscibacter oryzae]MBL4928797.1 hypothetical protein [Fuscibacter oryzae]
MIKGKGTITYDDGQAFEGDATLDFQVVGNLRHGAGTFAHAKAFTLAAKGGQPILACGGQRIRVLFTEASMDGLARFNTSGDFLSE